MNYPQHDDSPGYNTYVTSLGEWDFYLRRFMDMPLQVVVVYGPGENEVGQYDGSKWVSVRNGNTDGVPAEARRMAEALCQLHT